MARKYSETRKQTYRLAEYNRRKRDTERKLARYRKAAERNLATA